MRASRRTILARATGGLRGFERGDVRFLGFGFAMTFFSSFGQTFLVSLFGADLRRDFDLSHGEFGLLYSLATLASGTCLIWLGRLIDVIELRRFAALVCLGLASSCAFLGAVPSAALLTVALFALRFTGQGLMSHTSLTSMARYFDENRGKAISVAMLGFPAGQAVFPAVLVAALGIWGWRNVWLAIGAGLAVLLVPLVLSLLRGHETRHRRFVERVTDGSAAAAAGKRRHWTRREMVRDPRLYLALPALVAPTFILTGLFFHQVHLVESKGWTLSWMASCFVALSVTQIAGSLAAGPLVDRYGAPRLLRFFLAPLAVALAALIVGDAPLTALGYMLFAGVTAGAGGTIGSALWAEVYGVAHLGAIRSLTTAITVFSTAASPVSMGWLIDRGVSMETIAAMCLAYTVAGTALTRFAYR